MWYFAEQICKFSCLGFYPFKEPRRGSILACAYSSEALNEINLFIEHKYTLCMQSYNRFDIVCTGISGMQFHAHWAVTMHDGEGWLYYSVCMAQTYDSISLFESKQNKECVRRWCLFYLMVSSFRVVRY